MKETSCVSRATESKWRWSDAVGSPWTAMLFLSCRIVFPADTCTVTVLMPSRENVHATLPSRVITGCWGRKRETDRSIEMVGERERVRVRYAYQRQVSHCCYLHYRGVSLLVHSQIHCKKWRNVNILAAGVLGCKIMDINFLVKMHLFSIITIVCSFNLILNLGYFLSFSC